MQRDHQPSYSAVAEGPFVRFKLFRSNGIGQPIHELEVLLAPNQAEGMIRALDNALSALTVTESPAVQP